MQEFEGEYYVHNNVAIGHFVAAARQTEEPMLMLLNGIRLEIHPQDLGPQDYEAQLIWTFWVAFEHSAIFDKRIAWRNLVPELQALTAKLFQELAHLNTQDTKAVLHWLVRAMPAVWCKWAWDDNNDKRVVSLLEKTPAFAHWRSITSQAPVDQEWYGHYLVKSAMGGLIYFKSLSEHWLAESRAWLVRNA